METDKHWIKVTAIKHPTIDGIMLAGYTMLGDELIKDAGVKVVFSANIEGTYWQNPNKTNTDGEACAFFHPANLEEVEHLKIEARATVDVEGESVEYFGDYAVDESLRNFFITNCTRLNKPSF